MTHIHSLEPARCCSEEHPQEVLAKLANPPERQGYPTPHGWNGESDSVYAQRLSAWEEAKKREQSWLQQGLTRVPEVV